MCAVQLPPDGYPIAVSKYIISSSSPPPPAAAQHHQHLTTFSSTQSTVEKVLLNKIKIDNPRTYLRGHKEEQLLMTEGGSRVRKFLFKRKVCSEAKQTVSREDERRITYKNICF
jgi:hypothetical protein